MIYEVIGTDGATTRYLVERYARARLKALGEGAELWSTEYSFGAEAAVTAWPIWRRIA